MQYSEYGMQYINKKPVLYPEEFELPSSIVGGLSAGKERVKYRLSSVVEHFGMMPQTGHYIAYKRLMPE